MKNKPAITDPNILAHLIASYGGTVIPGPTFRFDLPMSEVKEVIPKVNALGVRCRNVGQRIADHPTQLLRQHTVVTVELYKDDPNAPPHRVLRA